MIQEIIKHRWSKVLFWNKKIIPGISIRIGIYPIWFPYEWWDHKREEAEEIANLLMAAPEMYELLKDLNDKVFSGRYSNPSPELMGKIETLINKIENNELD